MEKLKKFHNGSHKKKIVLQSLTYKWQRSKDILKRIYTTGFEWKGLKSRRTTSKRPTKLSEEGRAKSLSWYLTKLPEVESREIPKEKIKEYRLKHR